MCLINLPTNKFKISVPKKTPSTKLNTRNRLKEDIYNIWYKELALQKELIKSNYPIEKWVIYSYEWNIEHSNLTSNQENANQSKMRYNSHPSEC